MLCLRASRVPMRTSMERYPKYPQFFILGGFLVIDTMF